MSKSSELSNQRFGRLTVIERKESDKNGKAVWQCLCDCGKTTTSTTGALTSGSKQSCGCLMLQRLKEYGKTAALTHGLTYSVEFRIWRGMLDRCYNEKNIAYHRYGGRGITVCDEWKESALAFYNDVGPRPSVNHSIDRKDNDKGYSKENCRWATSQEQAANRERSFYFEYNGERKLLIDWCRILNLKYSLIYYRIKVLNWEFHEAIQPIESLSITFENETKPLQEWCDLFDLKYNQTYIRILRGETFEDIIKN